MKTQAIDTASGYRDLPLARLIESPHNPRRRFNEKALNELAASMEEHGVLTPLLARPYDGDFEIAAGHRRARAAKLAGFVTVPVIVRQMTDEQFMEILTVENLQREDVHAYEEAQGYAELLKMPGYNVEALAAKIGRSASYVHSRLKLLNLIPDVADAFLEDRITFAHARLIAPLAADKQPDALKRCFSFYGKKELLPASALRQWLQDEGGEDLSDASFDINDAELIPEAGACIICPKSTCAEGKLFADDRGHETCYDKSCFEAKLEATVAKHAKAGLVAISNSWQNKEAPAGALLREEFTEIEVRTEPLEEGDELDPEEQECKFMEDAVITNGSQKGKTAKICRNPKCPIHGKQTSTASSASSGRASSEPNEWQQKRAAEEKQKKAAWAKRRQLYDLIVQEWAPCIDRPVLLLLVVSALGGINHKHLLAGIAAELGVSKENDLSAQRAVLYTWAEKAGVLQLRAAFIRLFFAEHIEREEWDRSYDLLTIASDVLKDDLKPKRTATAKPAKKAAKRK